VNSQQGAGSSHGAGHSVWHFLLQHFLQFSFHSFTLAHPIAAHAMTATIRIFFMSFNVLTVNN
jgi:hypothetical protein